MSVNEISVSEVSAHEMSAHEISVHEMSASRISYYINSWARGAAIHVVFVLTKYMQLSRILSIL